MSEKLDNPLPQTYNVSYLESAGKQGGSTKKVNYSIRNGKMIYLQSTMKYWSPGDISYCWQQNNVDGIVYCECNFSEGGERYNFTNCRNKDIIQDQAERIPLLIEGLHIDSMNWTNISRENGCYTTGEGEWGNPRGHIPIRRICFIDDMIVNYSSFSSVFGIISASKYSITY